MFHTKLWKLILQSIQKAKGEPFKKMGKKISNNRNFKFLPSFIKCNLVKSHFITLLSDNLASEQHHDSICWFERQDKVEITQKSYQVSQNFSKQIPGKLMILVSIVLINPHQTFHRPTKLFNRKKENMTLNRNQL